MERDARDESRCPRERRAGAVMTGMAGTGLTTTVVAAEGALVQPPAVTVTV